MLFLKNDTSKKAIISGAMFAFAGLSLGTAVASTSSADGVEYEFAFATYDGESAAEMQQRLAEEASSYCAQIVSETAGLYQRDCVATLIAAVNAQIGDPSNSAPVALAGR